MHKTAIEFAVRHKFRLGRTPAGIYYLVDSQGRIIAVPAWGNTTAAGAIRMMRYQIVTGSQK